MLMYTNTEPSGYTVAERFRDSAREPRMLRRAWFAHEVDAVEYMRRLVGDKPEPNIRVIHEATGELVHWRGLLGPKDAVERITGGPTENMVSLADWRSFADQS